MGRGVSTTKSPPEQLARELDMVAQELQDDGVFPNSKLPLLLYRKAVVMSEQDPAAVFERLFAANGWRGS